MKKLVALFLAAILLLSASAAVAEVDLSKYVDDPSQKITIAWMAGHDTTEVNKEDPVLLYLNDLYNVDIQPMFLDRTKYFELLTTRIMSGNFPDVFLLENASQFATVVGEEICLELDIELIKKYMPNSYAWLMEYDPTCFYNVSVDGKIYGLPRVNMDGGYNYAPYWRKDWLEKFGYTNGTVPMTLNECEEVFYKFANEDPDGNGIKDTYALSETGFLPIYGAFGVMHDRWVEDENGDLVFGAVAPAMKEALTLLAKWYKDGLIDPEFVGKECQGKHWSLSVPFELGQIGFSSSGAFYQLEPDFDGPEDELAGTGGEFQYGKTVRTFAAQNSYDDQFIIGYNPTGFVGTKYEKFQGGDSWGKTTSEAVVFSYKLADDPAKLVRILKVIDDLGSNYDTWAKIYKWDLNVFDTNCYVYDELMGYLPVEGYSRDTTYGDTHTNMFNTLQPPQFKAKAEPARYGWANSMPMFHTGGYSRVLLPVTTAAAVQYSGDLKKLQEAVFADIIAGIKPVEYFDTFVKDWYARGGEQMTKEANEWWTANVKK